MSSSRLFLLFAAAAVGACGGREVSVEGEGVDADLGILAWTDNRAYTLEPQVGGIRLYAATLADDLTTGGHVVFEHARFFQGNAELRAAPAGTNVLLYWLDERHGNGILDPRPEIWTDTVWY